MRDFQEQRRGGGGGGTRSLDYPDREEARQRPAFNRFVIFKSILSNKRELSFLLEDVFNCFSIVNYITMHFKLKIQDTVQDSNDTFYLHRSVSGTAGGGGGGASRPNNPVADIVGILNQQASGISSRRVFRHLGSSPEYMAL